MKELLSIRIDIKGLGSLCRLVAMGEKVSAMNRLTLKGLSYQDHTVVIKGYKI